MGLGGYVPYQHDRGLDKVAREIVDKEIERRVASGEFSRNDDEAIGKIEFFSDAPSVACFAGLELSGASTREDIDATTRLADILDTVAGRLGKNFPYGSSALVLYEALKRFPNSPLDFDIRKQGWGDNFYAEIREKTRWVVQELRNVNSIPESRQKDLARFCSAFYNASRRGANIDACLAA